MIDSKFFNKVDRLNYFLKFDSSNQLIISGSLNQLCWTILRFLFHDAAHLQVRFEKIDFNQRLLFFIATWIFQKQINFNFFKANICETFYFSRNFLFCLFQLWRKNRQRLKSLAKKFNSGKGSINLEINDSPC